MLLLFQQPPNQPPSILTFTVVAALVSAGASFIALIVKDYFFARSIEEWKSRRTLNEIYQRYRDPIFLAARELSSILIQICDHEKPPIFLKSKVMHSKPQRQESNAATDPYYLKYKLTSAVYRFCSFLGWLELYRQDIVFLNTGESNLNRRLDSCIRNIRDDLADGQLLLDDDLLKWKENLVFGEEQRAIGEMMIVSDGRIKSIIGYGKFFALFESSPGQEQPHWIGVAINFFLDQTDEDYRRVRMKMLVIDLVDLMELLCVAPVPVKMIKRRGEYKSEEMIKRLLKHRSEGLTA